MNEAKQIFGWGLTYRGASAVSVISEHNIEATTVTQALNGIGQLACLDVTKLRGFRNNADVLKSNCPESRDWLNKKFLSWYIEFLATHPKYVTKLFMAGLVAGNSPYTPEVGTISLLPSPVEGIFFGKRDFALRNSSESAQNIDANSLHASAPIFLWIVAGLVLLSHIGRKLAFGRLSKLGSLASATKIYFLSCFFFVFSLLGILVSSLMVPYIFFRQNIPFQISLFLSVILAFGVFNQLKKDATI
jgi:hypothetical protein